MQQLVSKKEVGFYIRGCVLLRDYPTIISNNICWLQAVLMIKCIVHGKELSTRCIRQVAMRTAGNISYTPPHTMQFTHRQFQQGRLTIMQYTYLGWSGHSEVLNPSIFSESEFSPLLSLASYQGMLVRGNEPAWVRGYSEPTLGLLAIILSKQSNFDCFTTHI